LNWEQVWTLIAAIVGGYLLGSINPSIILTWQIKKIDIRKYGSGNAGMSNTLRVMGKTAGALVALLDILKAVLAALLGSWLMGRYGIMASGGAAVIGHAFPIFHHFKGGKGVWVSAVILTFLDWHILLACLVAFLALVLLTRKIAAGSIAGAVAAPVGALIAVPGQTGVVLFAFGICVFVLFLHRGNIRRLVRGTEPETVAGEDEIKKAGQPKEE